MPIFFSDHAKLQLRRRKITQRLVLETIRNPVSQSSSFKNRKLRRRRFGDKILEVATKTEGPRIIVITGYYLKK